MEPVSPEVEQYVRELFDKFPCHHFLGMQLEAVGKGEVVVSVKVTPQMTTCYKNSMQGGFLETFVDSPLWLVLMTDPDLWGLVIRTKPLPFVDPFKIVYSGETLKIYARYVETYIDKKKRLYYLSAAEVKNSKGELVAIARATNLRLGKIKKTKKGISK